MFAMKIKPIFASKGWLLPIARYLLAVELNKYYQSYLKQKKLAKKGNMEIKLLLILFLKKKSNQQYGKY